jgi:hypothetical protein
MQNPESAFRAALYERHGVLLARESGANKRGRDKQQQDPQYEEKLTFFQSPQHSFSPPAYCQIFRQINSSEHALQFSKNFPSQGT